MNLIVLNQKGNINFSNNLINEIFFTIFPNVKYKSEFNPVEMI
jgi:hypothetical protein